MVRSENDAVAFVITNNFMTAGHNCDALAISILQLSEGQFHTVRGSRLWVSESQVRYCRKPKYLTSIR